MRIDGFFFGLNEIRMVFFHTPMVPGPKYSPLIAHGCWVSNIKGGIGLMDSRNIHHTSMIFQRKPPWMLRGDWKISILENRIRVKSPNRMVTENGPIMMHLESYWCVLRREFSGMIHFITSNAIIPANPSNPSIPIASLD